MSKLPWNYSGKCPKLPWMIDFHSTENGEVLNDQFKSAFGRNRLQHLIDLHPRSKGRNHRLTQLICQIPPHCTHEMVTELLRLGMSAALVSSFKITLEECRNLIKVIKEAYEVYEIEAGYHYSLAVILDLARPEITTGSVKAGSVELIEGSTVRVTSNPLFENRCSKDFIYVNYQNIADVLKPGDSLVLGSGDINLSALHIAQEMVECIVARAGSLISHQSVSIPNTPIDLQTTPSFQEDFVRLGLELSIDGLITSHQNLKACKDIIGETVQTFVKIESGQVFDQVEFIIQECDGIFLDTEKLLISLKEKVFVAQKSIIARCNKEGTVVITPIGKNASPKSFINDLANTIIDGVDCLLVPYDLPLIELVTSVCKSAENSVHQKQLLEDLTGDLVIPIEPIYSVALSAVELSFRSNAAAIIVITTSGRCTRLLAKFRPKCPIIALTRYYRIARQLHLHKAIVPLFISKPCDVANWSHDVEMRIQYGITFGKFKGLIKMGDALVLVTGNRPGSGFTNNVRVIYASEYDTVPSREILLQQK